MITTADLEQEILTLDAARLHAHDPERVNALHAQRLGMEARFLPLHLQRLRDAAPKDAPITYVHKATGVVLSRA
jgi:hypothetical protein